MGVASARNFLSERINVVKETIITTSPIRLALKTILNSH